MIIVSALSLSLRDKEREREKREIELDNNPIFILNYHSILEKSFITLYPNFIRGMGSKF